MSVTVNEPLVIPVCSLIWRRVNRHAACLCLISLHTNSETIEPQKVAPQAEARDRLLLSFGENLQTWRLLHINEWVCMAACASVTVNVLHARWSARLFPGEWETWKQGDFYGADITAKNAVGCLHPIMGEKLPLKKKNTLSNRLHSLKSPKEGKVSRMEKKEPTLSHQYFLEPGAVLDLHGSPRQLSFV